MEEIRRLQQQLTAAQASSNIKKLHERNCVELLQRLIQNDRVTLVHTISGKEWLTPEQLEREIREAILLGGGRLNVTDLPGEIGVSIEHIEAKVTHMCKKDSALIQMQGEVIGKEYLQGLARELDESLAETGCLALSDLAVRYNLPADFIRSSVFSLLDTSYVFKQNMIYTSAYEKRMESKTRGALRGCTQPITSADLAAHLKIESEVVATAIQKLLKAGTIQGQYKGATFTPQVFSAAQGSRADDFFGANRYLTMSLAKSCGTTLKDWQKEKKAEGVVLESIFLAEDLIPPVLASVNEAISSKSWVDVLPLLPESVLVADASALLRHLQKKKSVPSTATIIESCALSKEFITSLSALFDSQVKEAAEKAAKAPAPKAAAKAPKAAKKPVDDDDDDDWDDGPKGKKGKAPKKGAKGKKAGKAVDADEDQDACAASPEQSSGISDEAICDLLVEKFPEFPDAAHAELCTLVQPQLMRSFAKAQEEIRASMQAGGKARFDKAEKAVQEKHEQLALGLVGLEKMDLLESPLLNHLLKETLTDPLHLLLSLKFEELTGEVVEVVASNRKQILDKIAAKDGSTKGASFKKVLEAINNKDHASSLELLRECADENNIFCRKVDKKREKSALQEQKVEFREKLKEVVDPAVEGGPAKICELALRLVTIQDGAPGLMFPAEPWAFKLVAQSLSDEDTQKVALKLCNLLEKDSDDPEDLLEAATALKGKVLSK